MRLFISLYFTLVSFCLAQAPGSSGVLQHFDASHADIKLADTLGNWQNELNDTTIFYADIIRTPDSLHLVRKVNYYREFIGYWHAWEIENSFSGRRQRYVYYSAIDVVVFCDLRSNNIQIDRGFWLFDREFGQGFLTISDSLYQNENYHNGDWLYHIAGKVDNLYFVLWNNEYEAQYNLMDLANAPFVERPIDEKLNFGPNTFIAQIEHFQDNNYFIQTEQNLELYAFEADSFRFVKTVLPNVNFQNIFYLDGHLLVWEFNQLLNFDLHLADTTFINQQILLEGDIYVDREFEYAVKIDTAMLYLFDIRNDAVKQTWDLSGYGFCFNPLIDYPDIYFHRTSNPTSIKNVVPKIPSNLLIVKAYPNPFNGSIMFKLNQSLNGTAIKIYDVAGRLVEQIDPEAQANSLHVIWRSDNLSSGIYFAVVGNGPQSKKLKLCYIK